jgi:hypothetical protein
LSMSLGTSTSHQAARPTPGRRSTGGISGSRWPGFNSPARPRRLRRRIFLRSPLGSAAFGRGRFPFDAAMLRRRLSKLRLHLDITLELVAHCCQGTICCGQKGKYSKASVSPPSYRRAAHKKE